MTYVYIILLLLLLGFLYMSFEAGFVQVKHQWFTKNKKGLRVLQLSDIHIHRMKVPWKKVKYLLDRESPDFIVISGDFIEKKQYANTFLNFLRYIKGKHSIYLCLGNHDYEAFAGDPAGLEQYMKDIEDIGAIILHDRSVCIEKNEKVYNLIGITDLRLGEHRVDLALSECNASAFSNIAFSHNPDIVLQLPKGKVDYLFAGHFHGGQIWTPFGMEFHFLRGDKLCKQGMTRGLHKVNGVNIYINRGLGNVCLPFRFLSRPEITVFHL